MIISEKPITKTSAIKPDLRADIRKAIGINADSQEVATMTGSEDCIMCGHPLVAGKRIQEIEDNLVNTFLDHYRLIK